MSSHLDSSGDDRISSLADALTERYRIEREIGAGGMATVYPAEDVRHHRKVAIKVLHPELSAMLGPERFLKEIQLTASLQHPHILPLFDSGSAHGKLWYAMPFIEGETLRARLEREHQLPLGDAVRIASEAADALDYAHRRGVVHRDIKPGTLARMPLEGGTPREMLDSVREADWSPDGASLAVIRVVGGRDRVEYPVGTVLFDTPGYLSDLRVSPDGERVAFFDHSTRFPYDDRGGVDVVDRAHHRTVLAKDFSGEEGLAWSADGSSVLFSASEGPRLQIREVGLDAAVHLALPTPGTMMMQDV